MNAKKITIFTPTYNRGWALPRVYESLLKQKNKDFKWLVIDDGSTDDTKDIIANWKRENKIEIEYICQRNSGKHVAINRMLDIVTTDLALILDSDDYLTENAIDVVQRDYDKLCKQGVDVCELIYLRADFSGNIFGEKFLDDEKVVYPIDYLINKGQLGERASVIVMKYWKDERFPVYENEKFMGESVLWHKIYKKQIPVFIKNEVIYCMEYCETGLTKSGRKMRIECYNGGIEHAKSLMSKEFKFLIRVKYTMLYVCYMMFAHKSIRKIYEESDQNKFILLISLVPGIFIYYIWKLKYKPVVK